MDGMSPVRRTLKMEATIDFNADSMLLEEELRLEARASLERYCFTMQNALNDKELDQTLVAGDKEKLECNIQSTLNWLNQDPIAARDEFEERQRSLDEECFDVWNHLSFE